MHLASVYETEGAEHILYDLLAERPPENWISHEHMPTPEEHRAFVASRPFFHWYLIRVGPESVGAIEVTDLNEIGVAIFRRFQRKGYGMQALRFFIQTHKPLPMIPARRSGHWLANIACGNVPSKLFFAEAGFKSVQETWRL